MTGFYDDEERPLAPFIPYDDQPQAAPVEPPKEIPRRAVHYLHSWEDGLELVTKNGASELANFRPTLLREIELRDAEGEITCEYDVRFDLTPTDSVTVRLHPEDIKSDRAFRERLTATLPLSKYIVYPRGWPHLLPALSELAAGSGYTREVAHASMGWVSYEPMIYLLPGARGIDAHGEMDNLTMDENTVQRLPQAWRNYGRGVRPFADIEQELVAKAFLRLINLSPVAAVIATQVLGGPLSPFGARITPPLVHVLGETGSFKTTISLACLSLTGIFAGEASIPETWTSTQNSLVRSLSDAKDITLLIDDYKHTKTAAEPTALVQNYADTTTRSRLGPDQERRKRLIPRGLLLSTGEDMWEGFQSIDARTIVLMAKRPDPEALPDFLEALSDLQDYAQTGVLAMLGGSWIMWLAGQSPEYLDAIYRERRDARLSTVQTAHMRLSATLASLLAITDIVIMWLTERLPEAVEAYVAAMNEAAAMLREDTAQQGQESATMSPYAWAITELGQAYTLGQISFLHRSTKVDLPWGSAKGQAIGYYDEENVYLTRQTSYDWFMRKAANAKRDLHFSWHGLLQGARNALGPWLQKGTDMRASYVFMARGHSVRALVIPRSAIVDPAETPDPDTEPE